MLKLLLCLLFSTQASAGFIEDFKVQNDFLKVDLFSLENRSFYLKSDLLSHGNIKSKINEVNDLQNNPENSAIEKFVLENKDKLFVIKANLEAGVKLYSQNNATDKISIYFKTIYDYSVIGGIGRKVVAREDFKNFFPSSIPLELQNFISSLSEGEDVIALCRNSQLSAETINYCNNLPLGTYIIPSNMETEVLSLLSKRDLKVGFFNVFTSGKFFSYFNLYGLHREEVYRLVGRDQVGSGSIYRDEISNGRWFLATDYLMGYNFTKNSLAFISFEEMVVSPLSEEVSGAKSQVYGNTTLIKVQTQSKFEDLTTLFGVQTQGYQVSPYLGGELKSGDFNYKVLASENYLSLSPRYNYGKFSLEYSHYFKLSNYNDWNLQDLDKISLRFDF